MIKTSLPEPGDHDQTAYLYLDRSPSWRSGRLRWRLALKRDVLWALRQSRLHDARVHLCGGAHHGVWDTHPYAAMGFSYAAWKPSICPRASFMQAMNGDETLNVIVMKPLSLLELSYREELYFSHVTHSSSRNFYLSQRDEILSKHDSSVRDQHCFLCQVSGLCFRLWPWTNLTIWTCVYYRVLAVVL